MIECINAHIQGQVKDNSITDLQNHIIDIIEYKYENLIPETGKCEWGPAVDASHYAAFLMFGNEHYIGLNSKNIEFSENFHYENFRPRSEAMDKMISKTPIKDFLIHLMVYRVGSYSYFAATVTPLVESNLDTM